MKKAIFLAAIVLANAINSVAVETELLSVKPFKPFGGRSKAANRPYKNPAGGTLSPSFFPRCPRLPTRRVYRDLWFG